MLALINRSQRKSQASDFGIGNVELNSDVLLDLAGIAVRAVERDGFDYEAVIRGGAGPKKRFQLALTEVAGDPTWRTNNEKKRGVANFAK